MSTSERRLASGSDVYTTISTLPLAAAAPASSGDICRPAETVLRICDWSRDKCGLPLGQLVPLGILGGIYIGLGGALATLAMSDSNLGAGPTRWLGGIAFSLGLILVVNGGAELSTGNCLMAIARLMNVATGRHLLRNWTWSYAANAAGALLLAWLTVQSGLYESETLRTTAIRIAESKLALSPQHCFVRGVLANMLVCLAVWLAMSCQSASGKIVGISFPISAFVALGLEHSIANLYLLPIGLMVGAVGTTIDLVWNVALVTAGNLVGGAILAAGLLWLGHARARNDKPTRTT
jgi:formate/nitrite transporter